MKTRQEQITEVKEEAKHLKARLEKIQELVAFDHELAKEVKKKNIEDNNNDR